MIFCLFIPCLPVKNRLTKTELLLNLKKNVQRKIFKHFGNFYFYSLVKCLNCNAYSKMIKSAPDKSPLILVIN